MNTSKHLILKHGENITSDVTFCKYNSNTNKYDITFKNNATYSCSYLSIEWVREPESVNPAIVHITHGDREFFKIESIYVFHAKAEDYWNIRFVNGSERCYPKSALKILYSCLSEQESMNCLAYLRQLAAINALKSKDGEALLEKQYIKLDFVPENTAMAIYLNPTKYKVHKYNKPGLIFPFGGNASQFKAVENAICNQISVIQGPPGTGKTQTILNIIANLLITGKTVQIVSNNNSATGNVLDKLSSPKYNMAFLVAPLGNTANKEAFIQNQTGRYPDLSSWSLDAEKKNVMEEQIQRYAETLSHTFSSQQRLAQARLELNSLLLEIKYFEQYCKEHGFESSTIKPRRSLKSETILQLWRECYEFSERERAVSFWFKIKSAFIYGISDWSFYKNNLPEIITLLQSIFYQSKQSELNNEISALEKYIVSTQRPESPF